MGEPGAPPSTTCMGYIRLPETSVPAEVMSAGINIMVEFAASHGWHLGEVFVDDDPSYQLAWAQLITAVRARRPLAVLIPDVPGLQLPGSRVDMLRARLRRATTAPLVVTRHDPVRPEPPLPPLDALIRIPLRSAPTRTIAARRARTGWRPSWNR